MSTPSAWAIATSDDTLPAASLARFARLKDSLLPHLAGVAG